MKKPRARPEDPELPELAATPALCAALDEAGVATADRTALVGLLWRWRWSAGQGAAGLPELMDDHAHFRLYLASRNGDERAASRFESHWRAYARASLGWRLPGPEIDDILSAFFERVYRLVGSRHSWRSPFQVYLRTIMLNVSRTHGRRLGLRAQRERSLSAAEELGRFAPETGEASPEQQALASERLRALDSALQELAPLDRHLVSACLVDGDAAAVVAQRLGMKRDALYKRLQRARTRLRQSLRRAGILEDA